MTTPIHLLHESAARRYGQQPAGPPQSVMWCIEGKMAPACHFLLLTAMPPLNYPRKPETKPPGGRVLQTTVGAPPVLFSANDQIAQPKQAECDTNGQGNIVPDIRKLLRYGEKPSFCQRVFSAMQYAATILRTYPFISGVKITGWNPSSGGARMLHCRIRGGCQETG